MSKIHNTVAIRFYRLIWIDVEQKPILQFFLHLSLFQTKKRHLIGYFEKKDSPEYTNFRRVASNMKDDCIFVAGFEDVSSNRDMIS